MTRLNAFSALVILMMALALAVSAASAQGELVASLEVLNHGVEVRRANTDVWVPINIETLVGVGDSVRTDVTGETRITFFTDGTSTTLAPHTVLRIVRFEGVGDRVTLSLEVLAGITTQQFVRLLDPGSSYEIITPGMMMTVRGTDFAVRVEDDGRSALLTVDGRVAAAANGDQADVEAGFGVRSLAGEPLSEVVQAATFEELDSALDGCPGTGDTTEDIRLNVRIGPGRDFERVGSVDPTEITLLIATNETGDWYRIPFGGGFGWISSSLVLFEQACPRLREFADDHTEDVSLYTLAGEAIDGPDAVVAVETANLRAGPSTVYAIVGRVERGDELTIAGRDADANWLQVRTRDGRTAWIAVYLARVNVDLSRVPVMPADSLLTPTPTTRPTATSTRTPMPTARPTATPTGTPAGTPASGDG